jgi:hypothetical protein
VAFLAVSGIAMHFLIAGMLRHFEKGPAPADIYYPLAAAPRVTPPAGYPLLQVSPPADWQAFHKREETELHSYGWINRTSGIVRVPIEKAMDLLLAKGLPTRANGASPAAGPSSYDLIRRRLPPEQQETQRP